MSLGTTVERPSRPSFGTTSLQTVRKHVELWHAVPALALLCVLVLQTGNADGTPYPNDDEGAYLSQAWAVWRGDLAHYTYWYDHPPLGWIQLALLDRLPRLLLPGASALTVGRITMTAVTAATLTLVYLLARRLRIQRPLALLALLVAGLSPLALALHRQVYLDNFAVPWLLAAFALALSPRRALWPHTAAGAALGCAVLSKETVALAAPAVLVALWQGSHPETRRFSLAGFASGLVLTVGVYPLWALLKGELLPGDGHVSLLGTLKFQLVDRAGTGSPFVPGTEAHELLQGWLRDDPLLLVAGALAAVAGLATPRARPAAVAALLLVLAALRPGGYLPKMYVVQVLPFFALAIAGVLSAAFSGRAPLRIVATVALPHLLVWSVPQWAEADARLARESTNEDYRQASLHLRRMDPAPGERIVTDGVLWLDAVAGGFRPGTGAIWHYKIDLDPGLALRWQDLDYVVSTPALRGEAPHLPTLARAIDHSTVIRTFGSGDGRIELRKIDKEAASP